MRKLLILLGFIAGVAGADEKGTRVRSTASVEVIDDARQVDEIIARIRAKREEEARAPEPVRHDRPAVDPRPRVERVEQRAGARKELQRRDREASRNRRERPEVKDPARARQRR
jgi:hypothetical protein